MSMMPITKLKLKTIETSEDEITEEWQHEHREEQRLARLGFGGDGDVPVLGLEEMEDELPWGQIEVGWRKRRRGIPVSSATPAEARQAREADVEAKEPGGE